MENILPCDIGLHLKDLCHKNTYTRNKQLLNLNNRSLEEKEEILWRVGILDNIEKYETICLHHEKVWDSKFESRYTKCSNIYNTHGSKKKAVKGEFLLIWLFYGKKNVLLHNFLMFYGIFRTTQNNS